MSARGIREQPVAAGTAQAVILYDRLEAMLAANQILGRLPPPDGNRDWTVNSWRFDMLDRGHEGEAALQEALAAELMVLAIENGTEVEDWPEEWLAHWAAGKRVAAARLVLVLVRPADRIEPAPVLIGSLRKLAKGANLRLRVLDKSGADLWPPAAPCSAGSHLHSLFGGPAGPPRDLGERSPQHFAEAAKPKPESASATAPLWVVSS